MSTRARSMRFVVFAVLVAGLLPPQAPAQSIDEKAQVCAGCHGENGIPQ